jgi:general secretion pathway protein H
MRMLSVGIDHQGGFTLVELIVVLALGGLLAAVLPPRLSALLDSAAYRRSVQDSANVLDRARMQAILQGRRVYVSVDADAGRITADSLDPLQLPPSILLSISGVAQSGNVIPALFFEPDGSASGGRIVVESRSRSSTIDLDWLTGQLAIESASK